MIKNERQYKIIRSRADEVRNTVGELLRTALPEGLQPEMRELQLDAPRDARRPRGRAGRVRRAP